MEAFYKLTDKEVIDELHSSPKGLKNDRYS
jgi:hypothetical protein